MSQIPLNINKDSKEKKSLNPKGILCVCVVLFAAHAPPGFSVHGIFQAKLLEQVAISYSRAFS